MDQGTAALPWVARSLGLLLLLGFFLATTVGSQPSVPGGRALVCGLVAVLAGILWLVTARPTAPRTAALLAVAVLTIAVAPSLVDEGGAGLVGYTLTWTASAATVAVLLSWRSLRTGLALGVATCTVTVATAITVAERTGLERLDPAVPVLNLVLCAGIAVAVRRGNALTSRMVAQAERAGSEAARASARLESERAADRRIHDEVLNLLSVLAHGAQGLDPELVRAACAQGAQLGNEPDGPSSDAPRPDRGHSTRPDGEPPLLADVLRHEGVLAGIDVRWHGEDGSARLTAPVRAAVTDAVRECIRNAARHGGVGAVDVVLSQTGSNLGIAVVDAGCGFDVDAVRPGRLGLRESVLARTAAVGGHAEIRSAPGRGTMVTLRVPLDRVAEAVTEP